MPQAHQQPHHPDHNSYVLFARYTEENGNRLILFIQEYDDVGDVEQRKAKLNRETLKQGDMSAAVGISRFHPHPVDDSKDFSVITPKDGSEPFSWEDMIDIKDIVEFAKLRGL